MEQELRHMANFTLKMTKKRSGRKGLCRQTHSTTKSQSDTEIAAVQGLQSPPAKKSITSLPLEILQQILRSTYLGPHSFGALWNAQKVNRLFRNAIRADPDLQQEIRQVLRMDATTTFDDVRFDSRSVSKFPGAPHFKINGWGLPRHAKSLFTGVGNHWPGIIRKDGQLTVVLIIPFVGSVKNLKRFWAEWDRAAAEESDEPMEQPLAIRTLRVCWEDTLYCDDNTELKCCKVSTRVKIHSSLSKQQLCDVVKHLTLSHPVVFEPNQYGSLRGRYPRGLQIPKGRETITTKWRWGGYSFIPGMAEDTIAARLLMKGEPTYMLEAFVEPGAVLRRSVNFGPGR